MGQAAPGAPEEGTGIQTLTQDPAAPLTSNRGLLKPKVQASTSEAPKHRESVTCCSSPKVSSTGTKSQTQAPKPALPTPKCVCPTQLFPAVFFPSFFSQVNQKLTLGSSPDASSPACSFTPGAPQELLLSSLDVVQNKQPCQLRILTLHLSLYTTQTDSNPQLPLTEVLASWELLSQCGSLHPVFAGWVWCSLALPGIRYPENTQRMPSTHQAHSPAPQTSHGSLSPYRQGL